MVDGDASGSRFARIAIGFAVAPTDGFELFGALRWLFFADTRGVGYLALAKSEIAILPLGALEASDRPASGLRGHWLFGLFAT